MALLHDFHENWRSRANCWWPRTYRSPSALWRFKGDAFRFVPAYWGY
jgi:hypothetical protein